MVLVIFIHEYCLVASCFKAIQKVPFFFLHCVLLLVVCNRSITESFCVFLNLRTLFSLFRVQIELPLVLPAWLLPLQVWLSKDCLAESSKEILLAGWQSPYTVSQQRPCPRMSQDSRLLRAALIKTRLALSSSPILSLPLVSEWPKSCGQGIGAENTSPGITWWTNSFVLACLLLASIFKC